MKKRLFSMILSIIILWCSTVPAFAWSTVNTPNKLHIIPEASDVDPNKAAEIVEEIGNTDKTWSVIEKYNKKAEEISKKWDLWMAFQTGVMDWNTLINYVVYLMRFLNQVGLLIWSVMILYAGYLYAGTIFGFWDPNKGKNAIKNAIIWVLIIVFSFAIWKGLESLFL